MVFTGQIRWSRTHVFVRFAPRVFLFEFREVIATRLTIVRPSLRFDPAVRLRCALDGQAARPHPRLTAVAPFRG